LGMREGNYDHGITVGEWKFFDKDGDLLAKQWYDDNGEVEKEKFFKKPKKKKNR
jgi:hypothetical protein